MEATKVDIMRSLASLDADTLNRQPEPAPSPCFRLWRTSPSPRAARFNTSRRKVWDSRKPGEDGFGVLAVRIPGVNAFQQGSTLCDSALPQRR